MEVDSFPQNVILPKAFGNVILLFMFLAYDLYSIFFEPSAYPNPAYSLIGRDAT